MHQLEGCLAKVTIDTGVSLNDLLKDSEFSELYFKDPTVHTLIQGVFYGSWTLAQAISHIIVLQAQELDVRRKLEVERLLRGDTSLPVPDFVASPDSPNRR